MDKNTTEQDLIAAIRHTGELEGAPVSVIEFAVTMGRTLLFPTQPCKRTSPAEAQATAEAWLRARTNRQEASSD